jgi:hypothetical protein
MEASEEAPANFPACARSSRRVKHFLIVSLPTSGKDMYALLSWMSGSRRAVSV